MGKNSKKSARITIDKLAIMMNNSFEKLEAKMATKNDIEEVKSKIEGIDKRIDDFVVTRVKYDEHNKLKIRVERLEARAK
ncbi:MAG: hypothetical protein AAB661_01120 [Patescibacteria group bacterium]